MMPIGRAGKSGIAMTYLTDGDSEVMYDLKQYLESTDSVIPQVILCMCLVVGFALCVITRYLFCNTNVYLGTRKASICTGPIRKQR